MMRAMRIPKISFTFLLALFFVSGATSGGAPVASADANAEQGPDKGAVFLELGPLLGHVGPAEAKIWAKASGPAKLAIRVGTKQDLSDARNTDDLPVAADTLFSTHLS